jgi:hypothetical protein
MRALRLAALVVSLLGLGTASAPAAAPALTLAQLPGAAGCMSADPEDGADCAPSHGPFRDPRDMAVSADGATLYMTSGMESDAGALVVFDRDGLTGALTEARASRASRRRAAPACRDCATPARWR